MALVAARTLIYQGAEYSRGMELEPQPTGRLRSLLLSSQRVVDADIEAFQAFAATDPSGVAVLTPADVGAGVPVAGATADGLYCDCGKGPFRTSDALAKHRGRAKVHQES